MDSSDGYWMRVIFPKMEGDVAKSGPKSALGKIVGIDAKTKFPKKYVPLDAGHIDDVDIDDTGAGREASPKMPRRKKECERYPHRRHFRRANK